MDSFSPPSVHSPSSSSTFHFTPNSSSSSSSSSSVSNFPVLIIAIIGILATAFLLVSYYIFVIKCCLNWHRIDLLRRFARSQRRAGEDPPPAYNPSAVSRGLEDSLIRLIPVIRFRKEAKEETEYLECSICLSEFKEGEKLRVLPNCCHAFHIDCIDIWLQSNANCPVCRSSISSNTLYSINRFPKNSNLAPNDSTQNPISDIFTGNDEDYVVIEILGNNLDDPIMVGSSSGDMSPISIVPSPWKTEHGNKDLQTSFDDEFINMRAKEDEFDRVHPIRRSISMDLSSHRQLCSEIREVLEQTRKQSIEETTSTRRSFFTFGSGRGGSRNAVLPLQLDS